MNEFQSIQSGSGILKDSYDESPVSSALKERRKKRAQSISTPTKDELENSEPPQ
jgi:hypothetical protein